MTLDQRKIDLIQRIARTTDERKIDAADKAMSGLITSRIDLSKHKNIKQHFDLEEVKRKNPRSRIDMKEWMNRADQLEWNESIEELLADLD